MSERNWQEDWDMCEEASVKPWTIATTTEGYSILDADYFEVAYSENVHDVRFIAVSRDALPYWLQEIKSLTEQLAHANCEWQREKSMRYSAIAREGQEKHRADDAEDREQKLKMFIEDLTKIDDGSFPYEAHERWKDIAARYLKQLYGDAA